MVDITMRVHDVAVNRHISGGYVIKATKSEGVALHKGAGNCYGFVT